MNLLCQTSSSKIPVVVRVIAGAILLFFGVMHAVGAAPMQPLVEKAGLPAPGAAAFLGTAGEIVAGLLLLSGAFARVGAVIAIGTMVGALLTHIRIPSDEWPQPDGTAGQEPMFLMVLAVLIILGSIFLAWQGAGAWSVDQRLCQKKPGGEPPAS